MSEYEILDRTVLYRTLISDYDIRNHTVLYRTLILEYDMLDCAILRHTLISDQWNLQFESNGICQICIILENL